MTTMIFRLFSLNAWAVLTLTSLTYASTVKAQNLTFSEIKMITTVQSVPTGKVWKIESVASTSAQALSALAGCQASSNSTQISVNGTTIHVSARYAITGSNCNSSASGGTGVATTGNLTRLPMWLPSGTSLAIGSGASFISVIEFTVTD